MFDVYIEVITMKRDNIAIIRTIGIRSTDNWEYIPVQISVMKYEKEKQTEIFDSMINPMCDIENNFDIPKHLNKQVLQIAPTPYTVAQQIKEFVKDCEMDADEISATFLKKMLII